MRVVVYGASWCGPCQKVKGELDTAEIPYVFRDIDLNSVAKQHARETQGTIPLVEIEADNGARVVVGGYDDTKYALDLLRFITKEL